MPFSHKCLFGLNNHDVVNRSVFSSMLKKDTTNMEYRILFSILCNDMIYQDYLYRVDAERGLKE
jgi:hypothetical protein